MIDLEMEDIICLGTVNAKADDRFLEREDLRPFQYIQGGQARQFPPLNALGEHGISSLVEIDGTIYLATGWDLWAVRPGEDDAPQRLDVEGLVQIHELSVIAGQLWIASTGADQLVCYDPPSRTVVERLSLPGKPERKPDGITNTYHCNQVFADDHGELLALVHHVDGRQHLLTLASKVISTLKKQGNGGIIKARTGEVLLDNLSGPHSVRKLRDGSWLVCDSCRSLVALYDQQWRLIRTLAARGWARGVAIGEKYVYVGISATRKRYLSLMPNTAKVPNMILVYDPNSWEMVGEVVMQGIEQVTDVCMMTPLMKRWVGLCSAPG